MATSPAPRLRTSRTGRPAGRDVLVHSAALGARAARADLAGNTARAARAVRQGRLLREHAGTGRPRQALRLAFDVGYGRQMAQTLSVDGALMSSPPC